MVPALLLIPSLAYHEALLEIAQLKLLNLFLFFDFPRNLSQIPGNAGELNNLIPADISQQGILLNFLPSLDGLNHHELSHKNLVFPLKIGSFLKTDFSHEILHG